MFKKTLEDIYESIYGHKKYQAEYWRHFEEARNYYAFEDAIAADEARQKKKLEDLIKEMTKEEANEDEQTLNDAVAANEEREKKRKIENLIEIMAEAEAEEEEKTFNNAVAADDAKENERKAVHNSTLGGTKKKPKTNKKKPKTNKRKQKTRKRKSKTRKRKTKKTRKSAKKL